MKLQRVVELERGVVTPDFVHAGDELGETVRAGQVPRPDLVFLRVCVLLGAGGAGNVLLQFEGGAVDAVVRAEGGREDQAGQERGTTPRLE